ncbi:hypothetical protein MPER_12093 [Moniliophthora perniciosa FA553]|nr:hypothetical protein MPER_12093 [Moniliophthora perniciosa FA553]
MTAQDDSVYTGACYCGAVSYRVTGKPLFSAYCHCSTCQKLTGFPIPAFQWTHIGGDSEIDVHQVKGTAKQRYQCKVCGTCVAGFHSGNKLWTVWGGQLERSEKARKDLAPTSHVFYDTRLVDVNDGLDKWEGYPGASTKM